MRLIARVGERQFTIALPEDGHAKHVTLDGAEIPVEWNAVEALPSGLLSGEDDEAAHYGLIAGTRSYDIFLRPVEGDEEAAATGAQTFEVSIAGRTYIITLQDERTRALAGLAGEGHISGDANIRAPMPGLVSNVLADEGATVERGQTLIVLEAMKMENDLTAPRRGIVKSLRVAKGQTVNQGDVLAVVGDPAGTPAPEDDETE